MATDVDGTSDAQLARLVSGAPTGALFAALSAVRRRRVFHPYGDAFEAVVSIGAGARRVADIPLLRRAATHDAVVRLSRGAGLPLPWPDIHGLALKLPGVDGEADQDLLLVTSGAAPLARHLLLPTAGFEGRWLSSVLPFRMGDRHVVVGAGLLGEAGDEPVTSGATFELAVSSLVGPWESFGHVTLGAALDAEAAARVTFNPWNAGAGIIPVGALNWLRDAAYRGSQVARPA